MGRRPYLFNRASVARPVPGPRQEDPSQPMPTLTTAWTLAILAHLFWGYLSPGGKILLEAWPPWTLNAVRMAIGTALVMGYYGREETRIGLKALLVDKHLAILGVVGVGVTFAFYLASLQYISATAAAVLIFLAPFMTAAIARVTIREPVGPHLVAAAVLALLGAYLALFGASTDAVRLIDPDRRFGLLIGLASVLFWAIYTVHLKVVSARYPIGRLTVAMFTAATAFFAINAVVLEWGDTAAAAVTTWPMLVHLALYILFPTTGAYLLYTAAVGRVGAGPITILLGMELLATSLLAHFLLGERFPPVRILGLVVVTVAVVGFVWAQMRYVRRRPERAP